MLRIGTAGWSILRRYVAAFPTEGSVLERYASVLDCAEINSTFYRRHRPETFERWAGAVPARFRFSVKLPKEITHTLRLRDSEAPVDTFLGDVGHLGKKLGPVLMQLPRSQAFDVGIVKAFLQHLRDATDAIMVCEPRHPSWFDEDAVALLAEYGVPLVTADPSPVADAPPSSKNLHYRRLHGSPRLYFSPYDSAALQRIADEFGRGRGKDIWCIFDNTASGAALGNALELKAMLAASALKRKSRRLLR